METFIVVAIFYFLPAIIALSRKKNPAPVIIVNLFLGWTLVAWVIALAMACGGQNDRQWDKKVK